MFPELKAKKIILHINIDIDLRGLLPFWDKVGASFRQEAAEEALLRQQEMEQRRQRHLEVLVQELPCNGRSSGRLEFQICDMFFHWILDAAR